MTVYIYNTDIFCAKCGEDHPLAAARVLGASTFKAALETTLEALDTNA